MPILRRPLAVLAIGLVLGSAALGRANDAVTDYDVKAAFLYNFAKFVEWPDARFQTADEAIVIGVLGNDDFADRLARIVAGKRVRGRGLVVHSGDAIAEIGDCHIVFVAGAAAERVNRVLAAVGPATLVVGETASFARRGGMINFILENRRVLFEINVQALTRAGLKASSQLLSVGRLIETDAAEEASG
jgi:YfiR/HmsC-like